MKKKREAHTDIFSDVEEQTRSVIAFLEEYNTGFFALALRHGVFFPKCIPICRERLDVSLHFQGNDSLLRFTPKEVEVGYMWY